jgi:hypothetical protein
MPSFCDVEQDVALFPAPVAQVIVIPPEKHNYVDAA